MNKVFILGVMSLFLLSGVYASVELTNPVNSVYNLGEIIELDVKIVAEELISDSFSVELICGLKEVEVYKEFSSLSQGDSRINEILIPLIENFIGNARGDCYISYSLGNDSGKLVENVEISDSIKLNLDKDRNEFNPGELAFFQGSLEKMNGQGIEGNLEIIIKGIDQPDVRSLFDVEGNSFSLEVLIPEDFKSGSHLVNFYVYEKDSKGIVSNFGNLEESIRILQIPTNLEVFLEENRIQPGTSLNAKVILRDQTGEKIDAKVYAAVKNQEGEIVQKFEERTDISFKYFIALNESPKEWEVSAYSGGLTSKQSFRILENSEVSLNLINDRLVVENIGNIYYNENISFFIGEKEVSFNPSLEVGQSKEFILTAPKGYYEIRIGDEKASLFLTGNAVGVKESSLGAVSTFNFIWIFLILILLAAFIVLFNRYLKRRNFRRPNVNGDKERIMELKARKEKEKNKKNLEGMYSTHLKSELSLSINGYKQDASVMCLNLKNYDEIKDGEGQVCETIQRLVDIFEGEKGFVYGNNENIFFVFAPSRTKTFKNEMPLIEFADKALLILKEHNKKFKKLIHYGLSLNYGTIVVTEDQTGLRFASMGTFMTVSKKIAMRSKGQIYLSGEFKKRLGKDVKTELRELGSISAHILKEVVDRTKNSTFLEGFVARHKKEMARQEAEKAKGDSVKDMLDERD